MRGSSSFCNYLALMLHRYCIITVNLLSFSITHCMHTRVDEAEALWEISK